MIGRTVSHYRIDAQLGAGGMGVVYRAEDTRLGRAVALKFLSDNLVHDAEAVRRLRAEARAASALNHPGICTIHDIDEVDDHPFIVMELLKGRSLRDLLVHAPLRVHQLVDIGIEVADALQAAHAEGIVHRDITPANIFVTDQGHVKVLDFGLAKLATIATDPSTTMDTTHRTAKGITLGTVAYMSPEQATGEELDGRTDLFSTGVVLYECATGRHPFPGKTSPVILAAILNRAPVAAGALNPDLPPHLQDVINNCLEKDRELRYQSAGDLRADLKRVRRDLESGQSRAVGIARTDSAGSRSLTPPGGTPSAAVVRASGTASPAVSSGRRIGSWLAAAALAAVLLAAAWALRSHWNDSPAQRVAAPNPPPTSAEATPEVRVETPMRPSEQARPADAVGVTGPGRVASDRSASRGNERAAGSQTARVQPPVSESSRPPAAPPSPTLPAPREVEASAVAAVPAPAQVAPTPAPPPPFVQSAPVEPPVVSAPPPQPPPSGGSDRRERDARAAREDDDAAIRRLTATYAHAIEPAAGAVQRAVRARPTRPARQGDAAPRPPVHVLNRSDKAAEPLAMTINDAHCHFLSGTFYETLGRERYGASSAFDGDAIATQLGWEPPGTPEALADRWAVELDRHRVSRAALIASVGGDEMSVATAVRRHPDRFVGFFALNAAAPGAGDAARRAFGELGLRCACLFPAMHRYQLDDERVSAVFEAAAAHDARVFVHCGYLTIEVRTKLGLAGAFDLRCGNPLALAVTAARFPGVPVIVPHFGGGFLREALMAAEACANIYFDTSSSNGWIKYYPGLSLAQVFQRALALVGPDRLLFGTDSSYFPRGWRRVIQGAQQTILDELGVEPEVVGKIFGRNFDRLFPGEARRSGT